MDEEALKKELEALSTTLETKNKTDRDLAIKAFGESIEAKMKDASDAQKDAFENELKNLTEKLEIKMAEKIKVVQDHSDKLDAKLKKIKGGGGDVQKKHFNDILAEQFEEKKDNVQAFIDKKENRMSLEIKAPGDVSTGNVTGGTRYGELFAPRIIELPKRKMHVSELIPGGSIGPGNSFTFMRQAGRGEGDPAPVAEGAVKPQFDVDLEEATVPVENIAGWMRVTNKALRNIPGFLSFLQSRIPERFMRVMDFQQLYGPGTSNNLKGILTTGNFVASTSTISNPLIEKLIDDISLLEDTYERDANGILLRPVDYYSFFKNKASGSGEYDLPMGVTFEGGVLRLFGIPMYASTAITSPDYVVGDWAQGAQLLTQEAMKIEFFREDGDNVRENKVTIRVEGDFALPVYGPDYFIKGTTATS